MNFIHLILTNRLMILFIAAMVAVGSSAKIFAWGYDGHAAVGILSVQYLSAEVSKELELVLGSLDDQTIAEACNWPDTVRESDEWAWSYPLHYVNIPKGEASYLQSRDCPDQQCATEAVKKYATVLRDRQASKEKRRQAFAWICHLTGDLHQPLHAGYSGDAYDRGGNEFDITFAGEPTNLHSFWDTDLIQSRAGDWRELIGILRELPMIRTGDNWSPGQVDRWTGESHVLVQQEVYPPDPEIAEDYAERSWKIVQQRIITAASRLASIVGEVL